MLTLSVDPKVLAALKAAFPKPANSAVKALSKYINALHALITEAQSLGKDPFNSRFGLQSISLHDLANRGGQIGSARIRVHAWLEQQGYALVEAWLDLEARIAAADVVVTGEGRFDTSSLEGKGPGAVIARARRDGKSVHVFAGAVTAESPSGIAVHAITPAGTPLEDALGQAAEYLAASVSAHL